MLAASHFQRDKHASMLFPSLDTHVGFWKSETRELFLVKSLLPVITNRW